MGYFVDNAVARVEEFLKKYDTDQPAEILADIIHYCQYHNIDFVTEVETANGYVLEELGADEEEKI